MARAIGIDLGTAYSAVAAVRSGRQPEVLWNHDGDLLTPSVVLFRESGRPLIGKTAKHATKDVPADCAELVDWRMRGPVWTFTDSRGAAHGAEEICGLVMRRLADDAAEALGRPVRDVVVTVPAYLSDSGRQVLKGAAEHAGLTVLGLVEQPVAASVAFGVTSGTLMVYDLGGGTLDVTVMTVDGDRPRVMATDGGRDLGGIDFDERLMEHVASEVRKLAGPNLLDGGRREADLRERCEQAKHALSRAFQTRLFFSDSDRSYTVEVSRERFERMTKDLLRRTALIAEEVLGRAGLSWAGIDRILLVGGSTQMPMVRRMIERRLGSVPDTTVDPAHAVALGAAVIARDLAAAAGRDTPPGTAGSAAWRPARERLGTATDAHVRRSRTARRRDGELL